MTEILGPDRFLLCSITMMLVGGCVPQADPRLEPPIAARANHSIARDFNAPAERMAAKNGREASADWPALFGPDRTSRSDANLSPVWPPEGPPLVWQVNAGTGYGSPVAAADRVVFNGRIGTNEFVRCHAIGSGKLLWEHTFPTTAVCNFDYSDGPYSTPIIDAENGRVFNVGGQGQFDCLNLDDGTLLWRRELHDEYELEADIFPVGASPFLDRNTANGNDQLIFNPGALHRGAGIVSLDARSGAVLWESTEHGPSYGTPCVSEIHGQRFGFVLTDEGLVVLDPDTGKVDFHYEYRRKGDLVRNATSPLVVGDKVLLVSSGLGAACLRVRPDRSVEILWRQRRSIDSQYNTLIAGNEHVYGFTSTRQGGAEFRCISWRDGEVSWRFRSELRRGMGLATNDAIFVLGEHGHLATLQLSPKAPTVISLTESPLMTAPCYCSPAVYGDKLILKDERRVAVFDLGHGGDPASAPRGETAGTRLQ